MITMLQILFEERTRAPPGQIYCGPTDAWQSFAHDTGRTWWWLLQEPFGVAVVLAVFGLLGYVAAHPFLSTANRRTLYIMAMASLSAGLLCTAFTPTGSLRLPLLVSLATFLATGAATLAASSSSR